MSPVCLSCRHTPRLLVGKSLLCVFVRTTLKPRDFECMQSKRSRRAASIGIALPTEDRPVYPCLISVIRGSDHVCVSVSMSMSVSVCLCLCLCLSLSLSLSVSLSVSLSLSLSLFFSAGRRGRPCDPQAFGPPSPHVVFRKRLALGPPLTEVLYYWVGSRFSCSKPQPLTL